MMQIVKFNVQNIIEYKKDNIIRATDANPFIWETLRYDNGKCCDCYVYRFEKAVDFDGLNDEQIEELAIKLFLDEIAKDYPAMQFKCFDIKFEYMDENKQLIKEFVEYNNRKLWF